MSSIPKVSIRQLKAARALLGWSQADLARQSGVSEPTVKRLEASDGELGGRADTGEKMLASLEAAGVEFIAENGGGAGVRLKAVGNRYIVLVNGRQVTKDMAILDEAKRIALDGLGAADEARIEIVPATSTTPMSALRYDRDVEAWVTQPLP